MFQRAILQHSQQAAAGKFNFSSKVKLIFLLTINFVLGFYNKVLLNNCFKLGTILKKEKNEF